MINTYIHENEDDEHQEHMEEFKRRAEAHKCRVCKSCFLSILSEFLGDIHADTKQAFLKAEVKRQMDEYK